MQGWVTALRFLGVGWYISLTIVGGVIVGRWMDGKLGTEPLFILVGLVFGLVGAGCGVYKMLPRIIESKKR